MLRILVADDNSADVFVLQEAFRTSVRHCGVDWVKDGAAALDFLYRRGAHSNAQQPGLILLEMNMPGVSGMDVLCAVKSDPELCAIPVIMLSSSISPSDVRMSYLAHANCYVQKPTSRESLARLVRAIEAFWMEAAILPCNAGDAAPSFLSKAATSGSAGCAAVYDSGPEVALLRAEATSHAIKSEESAIGRLVRVSGKVGCEEHRRLLDEFGESVRELLRIHEDHFLTVTQGEGESSRFDLLVHRANEKKQMAKYAYIRHVESHGCANLDAIHETRTATDYR